MQSILRRAKVDADEYHPHYDNKNDAPRKVKGLREKLLKEHPYCSYCGNKVDESNSSLDHVIPKSKGGSNAKENLVLSCVSCNQRKGDKSVKEFKDEIAD